MKYSSLLFFLLFSITIQAQERPKLFLDCRTYCDMQFFKSEINYVDFMLVRQAADLYLLLIEQNTGGGGSEFIMTVENKKSTAEPYDIHFFTEPNAVEDDKRNEILKNLKKVILKYMVDEDMMDNISYSVSVDEANTEEEEIKDPWNAWVYALGVNGNINRESQFNSQNFRFNVSANRITEKHKFTSWANYRTNESNFTIGEGEEEETITNIQTSFFGNVRYVYSLTDKWSVGVIGRYQRSIFENYDHSITFSPAIEYNVFPYSEVAEHNFTFRYALGGRYNDYIDTTAYFKATELLSRHRFSIDYQLVKPWGNIDIDAGVSQFISRPDRYSIDINPSVDINIFKGLNFFTGIFYGITKDRINIPKGDLSVEEILLQNKLRDSNFSMYMYFGVRYRFGSEVNNVVNPRF